MSTEMPQIKRLFMLFHGMYGNQVMSKFCTGQLNEAGEDMGMLSAQAVWLNGLKKFDFEVIRKAVGKCSDKHQTFPPTLPEFIAICKGFAPTQWEPTAPQLGMSDELRAQLRDKNRELVAELKLSRLQSMEFGTGLPALVAMVAKSVGYAGGDEVKTLLTLENTFRARAA